MAFDGLKKIFDKIGGATIDSSKKVGEGVQAPVNKLGNMNISRPGVKGSGIKKFKPQLNGQKESPRVIERMKMDKDEIQMFKELIDKKYERKDKSKDEQARRDVYNKAALEEILKEEEKEGVDPKLIMGMGAVSFVVVVVLMTALGFGIAIGLVFGLLIFMMAGVILFLPKLQSGKRSSEASKELPFALRQMATELRAGLGLHESMRSVALSGYGPLSEEFARTLEEIRYGETTENALIDMSERINSEGLKRAIYQITRTLSSGGDLSRTLNVIAEDTAYEMRMKLKDYAQKLNSFTMIYMFVAILGPVILMIMLIAASTVQGPLFPPIVLLILYLFLFPMVVGFMAFMIKRLEPQI
ncbi:type II secretion system F family protein [Methanobacterium sp. ACI-7]|uniref:type II secretion system F family protein n=1 Tax=unclassified Methanobacterium TaxID=2627676 RepID=UPI0039C0A0F0